MRRAPFSKKKQMIRTQMNADFQDSIKTKIFSGFICTNLPTWKQKGFVIASFRETPGPAGGPAVADYLFKNA